jgi:hypothetical protein
MPTETAPRSKQRTLYMPDPTAQILAQMAQERKTSISRLVRHLVEAEAKREARRKAK